MNIRTLGPIGLISLVAFTPAFAATPINETRPLATDGRVSIENIKGNITVRTWAKPEVRITGSLGKGAEKLAIDGDSDSLDIEVKYPERKGGWGGWNGNDRNIEPTVLEITMPQRASLAIDSVSADVDVQQMAGRELEIDSVSGNIVVTASSPGEAQIESVSGDATLRITTRKAQVSSVSGDIRLSGGLTGVLELESVSGNIELGAQALNKLAISTVSGDSILQFALATAGTVRADTVSGDLRLTMPANTSAQLAVESFSGDITSPVGKVDEEEYGPGKSLNARLGSGQGTMKLESFSGDVTLLLK